MASEETDIRILIIRLKDQERKKKAEEKEAERKKKAEEREATTRRRAQERAEEQQRRAEEKKNSKNKAEINRMLCELGINDIKLK